MNSELLSKLNGLLTELEEEVAGLSAEYNELNALTRKQTRKDKARIKEIKKEMQPLALDIEDLKEDIDYLEKLETKICELALVISKSKDAASKYIVNQELEAIKEEQKAYEESLEDKYSDLLQKDKPTKKKPIVTKKRVVSALAILLALGIGVGVLKGWQNKRANSDKDSVDTVTETDDLVTTVVDELVAEVGTFTDINDPEQVALMASEVVDFLDTNNPGHDYTVEEIENIARWINGGVVEEVGTEEALFAITRVETLMNRENQAEVKEVFDASTLFLDGSQGQKLASKIYESRVKLQETKGTDEYKTAAEDFATLLVNSWALNGANNEISAYALETSGMEALIDTYFLNTYAMIDEENVVVTVNDVEFTLDQVAEEINEANCATEVTADNGETFTTYMNKFSSDMTGMVTEATINKSEHNSLTLTK